MELESYAPLDAQAPRPQTNQLLAACQKESCKYLGRVPGRTSYF